MGKQYIVWAESAFHSTHSHICNSYKEALAVKKEMQKTLYGKYKFSIKQINQ